MRALFALVALFPMAVLAQTAPTASAPKGEQVSRFAFLAPSARISGDRKEAKGSLKVQLPVMRTMGGLDYILAPTVEATSRQGVAEVLSFSQDKAKVPIGIGATLTMVDPAPPVISTEETKAFSRIVDDCRAVCACGDKEKVKEACKNFCEVAGRSASQIGSNKLCPGGKQSWAAFVRSRPTGRGVFARWKASLGYLHQNERLEYLQDNGGGALVDGAVDTPSWRAVLYGAYVCERHLWGQVITAEGRLRRAKAWTPSSINARWCTPAGSVGSDPAQSCNERVLGAPSIKNTMQYSAAVGLADFNDGFWRAAAGAYYEVKLASKRRAVGLELPIYFDFASAPSGYAGDYKAVLRLVPAIEWQYGPGGRDVAGFLKVELLGQRTLFADALDF